MFNFNAKTSIESIFLFSYEICKAIKEMSTGNLIGEFHGRIIDSVRLARCEVMTILILFQDSGYQTFKNFYIKHVCKYMNSEFKALVSYNRFIELEQQLVDALTVGVIEMQGRHTGNYYIDSTPLELSHHKRRVAGKAFKGVCKIGKTTNGWFKGCKLHIVTNEYKEIVRTVLTKGNVSDVSVLDAITEGLVGTIVGDKGYIGKKIAKKLKDRGLTVITRQRANMKHVSIDKETRDKLNKRQSIETVIGLLKEKFHLQHTRHRSLCNFIVNVLSCIIAYGFYVADKIRDSFEHISITA